MLTTLSEASAEGEPQNPSAPGEARPQRSNEGDFDIQAKDHLNKSFSTSCWISEWPTGGARKAGLVRQGAAEGSLSQKESTGRGTLHNGGQVRSRGPPGLCPL